jgi:hypothetical protein
MLGLIMKYNGAKILERIPMVGATMDPRRHLVLWQDQGRHICGIVNASHDQWAIGIAVFKCDQNLMPASWPEKGSPSVSGP